MQKQSKETIESEFKFILKLLLKVISLPLVLIQVIFGKKHIKHLFEILKHVYDFIFQPKFCITIIILNIIIFIISVFLPEQILNALIIYPSDFMSFRFFSLFTSGFLHANFAHLFGNMFAIFVFGRIVERKFGSKKTAFIYFASLIISGLFSSIINLSMGNNIGGLGASGALMGLVSTAILIDPLYITYIIIPMIPIPIMIAGWFAIWADITGILNPIADGIGHFAHLGGFLAISLIVFLLDKEEQAKLKKGFLINLGSLALIGIIIFFVLRNGLI